MSRNFGIEGSFKAGVRQFWFIHFMPLITDVYDGRRVKMKPHPETDGATGIRDC
jgi:hypothetical protein